MGIKEDIERAIIAHDWEEVRKVYKFLFKEEAPATVPLEPTIKGVSIEDIKKAMQPLLAIIDINMPFEISQNEDLTTNANIQFITGNDTEYDNDLEYQKAMKEHAKLVAGKRKESRRPAYQSDIRNCPTCQASFDYNKEYPVGELTDQTKGLCSKCAGKSRVSR